jgi:hypothetical protein
MKHRSFKGNLPWEYSTSNLRRIWGENKGELPYARKKYRILVVGPIGKHRSTTAYKNK